MLRKLALAATLVAAASFAPASATPLGPQSTGVTAADSGLVTPAYHRHRHHHRHCRRVCHGELYWSHRHGHWHCHGHWHYRCHWHHQHW